MKRSVRLPGSPCVEREGKIQCGICQEWKHRNLENFKPSPSCKSGISGRCRSCSDAYMSEWKRKNRERLSKKRRELYAKKDPSRKRREARAMWRSDPYRKRGAVLRSSMLDRSKKLDLPFDSGILDARYIARWLKSCQGCECCGRKFRIVTDGSGTKCDASPSVDRIHPKKGYVLGNIALLCWRCNNLKRDSNSSELGKVVEWMKSKGV